jgi:Protein of unknown function (DUF2568)
VGQTLYWANLALAFALELCALVALGLWGFSVGGGPVAKAALGLGAPLCAAVLWGLFAAPRAPVSVPFLRFVVKVVVFGSASLALYATGHRALAVIFAFIVGANAALIRLGR